MSLPVAIEGVREMVHERLAALDIDADSYAEYVATNVCDDEVSPGERRTQLMDMFAATLEDPDAVALSLSDVLSEALLLYEQLKAQQTVARPAEVPLARAPRIAEPAVTPGVGASQTVRQLQREDGYNSLNLTGIDPAMKRAILAQLALEGGSSDESDSGAPRRGGTGARARRRARDGPGGGGGARTLDDALRTMSQLAPGGGAGTADMGRRAKRAAARAAEEAAGTPGSAPLPAAAAAPRVGGRQAVVVSDDPTILLNGSHAGAAQRSRGKADGKDRHQTQHLDREAGVNDVVGRRVGGSAGVSGGAGGRAPGKPPLRDESGEDEGTSEEEGASSRVPATAAPVVIASSNSRLVVPEDPFAAPRPDNRAFARQLQRDAAEGLRVQHEAEELQRRQASEAARWVL